MYNAHEAGTKYKQNEINLELAISIQLRRRVHAYTAPVHIRSRSYLSLVQVHNPRKSTYVGNIHNSLAGFSTLLHINEKNKIISIFTPCSYFNYLTLFESSRPRANAIFTGVCIKILPQYLNHRLQHYPGLRMHFLNLSSIISH